jgi:hypothetical protein
LAIVLAKFTNKERLDRLLMTCNMNDDVDERQGSELIRMHLEPTAVGINGWPLIPTVPSLGW